MKKDIAEALEKYTLEEKKEILQNKMKELNMYIDETDKTGFVPLCPDDFSKEHVKEKNHAPNSIDKEK